METTLTHSSVWLKLVSIGAVFVLWHFGIHPWLASAWHRMVTFGNNPWVTHPQQAIQHAALRHSGY